MSNQSEFSPSDPSKKSEEFNELNAAELSGSEEPDQTFAGGLIPDEDKSSAGPLEQTIDLSESAPSIHDQTMDISEAVPSKMDQTMDIQSLSDQTIEFSVDPSEISISDMGTMILPREQAPFGGTVLLTNPKGGVDEGTSILPSGMADDQTMDISSLSSEMRKSSESGRSDRLDSGTIPLDSQLGSSSMDGRSSQDQTLDLTDSKSGLSGGSPSQVSSAQVSHSGRIPGSVPIHSNSMGESRQYIKTPRAEASDAIFSRITRRHVSELIESDDERADYQIRKRIDPKTGRLGLHVLGEGGMGLVYFATQNAVKRPVALKMIRKEKRSDNFSKQFFFEAEITAQLEHPNITPIYELGKTDEGVYFYSMKYIQGTPWEKKIRTNSIEENLEIFDKLCDAIAFAHSKEIIHMDIKPDNVVLGEFGEVYAVDWGVASDLKRPDPVRVAGTFQWISPEVAKGDKALIGKGSDIYLLGGILFLIVTGHHPRLPKDESAKLGRSALVAAAQNNIIQPTECTDPMLKVALKALATQPADRYAKVEDLQEAIRELQIERAKIKSSVDLTDRSKELAEQAGTTNDYDQYYRALYGFRDAMELWENNTEANSSLKKVRLDFGRCAYDKGDYDLALQILDPAENHENQLRAKVEQAKRELILRKERFRKLVLAFVSMLSIGSIVVGVLAFQTHIAKLNAEKAREEAVSARDSAELARAAAEKARASEESAKLAEVKAKDSAVKSRDEAREARNVAVAAKEEAEKARNDAVIARDDAVKAKEKEEAQKKIAVRLQEQAEKDLASSQLDYITRQLGLARARINEQAPSGGAVINDSINTYVKELVKDADQTASSARQQVSGTVPGKGEGETTQRELNVASNLLIQRMPNLDHWASDRIKYLTNVDLKPLSLVTETSFDPDRSAIAYGQNADSLIVANADGSVFQANVGNGKESTEKAIQQVIGKASSQIGRVKKIISTGSSGEFIQIAERPESALLKVDSMGNRRLLSAALADGRVSLDKQIPGDAVLSPNGKYLAVSYPNHLCILESNPKNWYLSHPVNSDVIQMLWLNDHFVLTLFHNEDECYLDLFRPNFSSTVPDEAGDRVIVQLPSNVSRIQVLNSNAEDLAAFLKAIILLPSDSPEILKNLKGVLERLNFVVGTTDGELLQTTLKLKALATKNVFVSQFVNKNKLGRKHLHAIEEIVLSPYLSEGGSQPARLRRMFTRTKAEESVQIWSVLQEDNTSDVAVSNPEPLSEPSIANNTYTIEHLVELNGYPVKSSGVIPENRFAAWTNSNKMLLSNALFETVQVDVDEQIRREKHFWEVATNSDGDRFSEAKWLFENSNSTEVTAVDGNGVVTVSDSRSGQLQQTANAKSLLKITQSLPADPVMEVDRIVPLTHASKYHYYGHSPYARIVHAVTNPDKTRLLSIATLPRDRVGYIGDHSGNVNSKAAAGDFQELCFWDLTNNQFLERQVIQSNSTNLRLFPMDSGRFLMGNSLSTTLVDVQEGKATGSRFLASMESTPVFLAALNPVYNESSAFFRVDGDGGTLWVGSIPTQATTQATQWLDLATNRFRFRGEVPVAACWSPDGQRLYVLQSKGKIERFDLDPDSDTLAIDRSESSRDQFLIPPQSISEVLPLLARPTNLRFGILKSSVQEDGRWTDSLYIAEGMRDRTRSRSDSVFVPKIGVQFSRDAAPTVSNVDPTDLVVQEEKRLADQIQNLITSNVRLIDGIEGNKVAEDNCFANSDTIHTPLAVTADATGRLLVMHWGNSTLICNRIEERDPAWFRLSEIWAADDQLHLSPDGKQLAVLGKKGLRLFSVESIPTGDGASTTKFNLAEVQSGLQSATAVRHFAWAPAGYAQAADGKSWPFAVVVSNQVGLGGAIEYFDGIKSHSLGSKIRVASDAEDKDVELTTLVISKIGFFKESLSDIRHRFAETAEKTEIADQDNPKDILEKHYIAVCVENQDARTKSMLFVDLAKVNANEKEDVIRNAYFQTNANFQNFKPNPNGGLIATSSCSGEVSIYLVSPYWNTMNDLFVANTDIDSGILQITFADDGKTLVVSNTNRHVFGLRTEASQ